ncbi:MAG: hypothetical protein ACLQAH_12705 [Limisphaerales bacterium]
MKLRFWTVVTLRLPRFLVYCLAVFTGVLGLLDGGIPLVKYAAERLASNNYEAYLVLSSYDRFSAEVIFILSLMLLILVHIGHAVGGGLHISNAREQVSSGRQQSGSPLSAGLTSQSLDPPGTPAQTDKETADEKLARLLKQKQE